MIFPDIPDFGKRLDVQEQLRRDFDYPPGAQELVLLEMAEPGSCGYFFVRRMEWVIVKREQFYNLGTGSWEWREVRYQCSRELEPSQQRYLL